MRATAIPRGRKKKTYFLPTFFLAHLEVEEEGQQQGPPRAALVEEHLGRKRRDEKGKHQWRRNVRN